MNEKQHPSSWQYFVTLGFPLLAASGCQGERVQSALHPSGPGAAAVADLWWVLLGILGVYSLAVFVLTFIAIFRKPPADGSPASTGRAFILIGGVILPAVILVPLLVYSVSATAALRMREGGLKIRVVGHRWWWSVEYPEQNLAIANELIIPAGEPVQLELIAGDVIHSFWVPQLHGKTDMFPDKPTYSWIEASQPGTYRGQCAEYCGTQHAHMAFVVKALPAEEFVAWLNVHRDAAAIESSAATEMNLGLRAFTRHGCAACHAIQGTTAQGHVGPDLTWMGERETIAAATLPHTTENLRAWLVNPQAIKPGAKMPPTHAAPEDIDALVAYLQSLKSRGDE